MRIQWTIAALLGAWSLVLVAAGAWSAWRPGAGPASPLGNGTPILFLVGGLGSALIGLVVAVTALDPPRRVGAALRALELGSFVLAVVVLVASILAFDPRHNIGMLAVVVLLLGISVSATRLRRSRQDPRGRPSPRSGEAHRGDRGEPGGGGGCGPRGALRARGQARRNQSSHS